MKTQHSSSARSLPGARYTSGRIPAPADQVPAAPAAAGGADPTIEMLLEKGLVSDAQVQEARLVQQDLGANLWAILIDIGHVSALAFHASMSKQPNVGHFDLANYSVPTEVADLLPADIIKRRLVFPVDKLGKIMSLGMVCPIDAAAIEEVQQTTGLKVKPMLCELDHMRAIIKTFHPNKRDPVPYGDAFARDLSREFDELLNTNEVANRIFDMDPVPPAKDTLDQVRAAPSEDGAALSKFVDLFFLDPPAAALMLSVSNSAAYGFARRVDNLSLACSLLGSKAIHAVFENTKPSDDSNGDSDWNALVKRSRYRAEVARRIATACESQRGIVAHMAAFLSELGRLAMLRALPSSYAAVTKGKTGSKLAAEEERFYRIDHAKIGYMLARKANLPPGLTEPLRYCFEPGEATKFKEVVSIVALASIVTDAKATGGEASFEGMEAILENLEVTQEQIMAAVNQGASG